MTRKYNFKRAGNKRIIECKGNEIEEGMKPWRLNTNLFSSNVLAITAMPRVRPRLDY